jgi:hypothetical protein
MDQNVKVLNAKKPHNITLGGFIADRTGLEPVPNYVGDDRAAF